MNGVSVFGFALLGALFLVDFFGRIRQSSSSFSDFPKGFLPSEINVSETLAKELEGFPFDDEYEYSEYNIEEGSDLSVEERESNTSLSDYSIEMYEEQVHYKMNWTPCKPRICNNSESIIIYTFQNLAGFGDRRSVLFSLSNIAASLCAKLVYAKPCKVLSHVKVSCKMAWHDIFDITFLHGPLGGTPVILPIAPANKKYNVRIKGGSYKHYAKALSALESGKTFRWIIRRNFYKIRRRIARRMFPHGEKDAVGSAKPHIYRKFPFGCRYIRMQYSARLFQIASNFLHDLKLQKNGFISLHLRRGDQKSVCNTELQRMKYYFDCWTKGNDVANKTMLLFSDERNLGYLRGLQKEARTYGINLRIDAEKKLASYFHKGFEIGAYQTSEIIQSQSALRYELRRSIRCNSKACDPIE